MEITNSIVNYYEYTATYLTIKETKYQRYNDTLKYKYQRYNDTLK